MENVELTFLMEMHGRILMNFSSSPFFFEMSRNRPYIVSCGGM